MTKTIKVNGTSIGWAFPDISFEEILGLAGMTGTPSMTYFANVDKNIYYEGIISPHERVLVYDNMVINCVHTGNA